MAAPRSLLPVHTVTGADREVKEIDGQTIPGTVVV